MFLNAKWAKVLARFDALGGLNFKDAVYVDNFANYFVFVIVLKQLDAW